MIRTLCGVCACAIACTNVSLADVVASVDEDGRLLVVPDFSGRAFQNNQIEITQTSANVLQIDGIANTRVNGSTAPVAFPAFDGDDIEVTLVYGSDNYVCIDGLTAVNVDDLRLNVAGDVDLFNVDIDHRWHSDVTITADLVEIGSDGSSWRGMSVGRNLTIYANGASLHFVDAGRDVRVPGFGRLRDCTVGRNLYVSGNRTYYIRDSTIGQNASIVMGSGNNTVTFRDSSVGSLVDVNMGSGTDTVSLNGLSGGHDFKCHLGNGGDFFTLDSWSGSSIVIDGGSGYDTLFRNQRGVRVTAYSIEYNK